MESLEATISASLHKNGARTFVLPGVLKATATAVPAKPKRKGKDPFTGEERMFAAKPASREGEDSRPQEAEARGSLVHLTVRRGPSSEMRMGAAHHGLRHGTPAAMAMHTRKWLVTGALLLASASMDFRIRAQPSPARRPAQGAECLRPSQPRRRDRHRARRIGPRPRRRSRAPGRRRHDDRQDAVGHDRSGDVSRCASRPLSPARHAPRDSARPNPPSFNVRRGETTQVLVDISLTFVAPGVEVVGPAAARAEKSPGGAAGADA